jgi:voltage-gated potassium channel
MPSSTCRGRATRSATICERIARRGRNVAEPDRVVPTQTPADAPQRYRRHIVDALERWLEAPLFVLGLVWLGFVIAELLDRLPTSLEPVVTAIWAVFVAEYVLRLWIADDRWTFLRRNWLTLLALLVPALRVFRIARVVPVLRATRGIRGVRAARTLTSLVRAKRSVHGLLGRQHALGYVVVVTCLVIVTGAAAMLYFEAGERAAFDGYAHALWWASMIVASLGTDTWPVTAEGRIVCLVLALYGFAVFGYITASLASWFVGRSDTESANISTS